MTTDLCVFDFDSNPISALVYAGKPAFVAVEVARALGYSDEHQALKKHCKSLIKLDSVETTELGFGQKPKGVILIREADVYRLVMRSKLPSAERFQDWVVEEVLPALRENGHYGSQPSQSGLEQRFDKLLNAFCEQNQLMNRMLAVLESKCFTQDTLTDQQHHTEPVIAAEEVKALPSGYRYIHHRDDEICFSEMEPYVSNPNLRKELIAIFKFEEREHDPGQKKVKGEIIKVKPYPVYKKADVLPVLKAAQMWKLNNDGKKLLGRGFSFKKEISATDYQGEKFDEAYAKLQDLNDKYLKEKQAK